jgi:hypothetical protein
MSKAVKKILGPVADAATNFQARAINKAEKIGQGETYVRAPMYPGEEKPYAEARNNTTIREVYLDR